MGNASGLVTYQADIDPEQVSICHCTDCQALTGSPHRVTLICSCEQIRMTGKAPKINARTGDNGIRPCTEGAPKAKQAARAVSSAG